MSLRRPRRRGEEATEWLDAGIGTREEIVASYLELARVNRGLGGHRATFGVLDRLGVAAGAAGIPWAGAGTRPFRVVDVAGGDGEFARRFVEWGAARGLAVRALVVDLQPLALTRASRAGRAAAARADALRLPLADRAVDLVHSSAFLHHLSTARARDALAEMCRVSRRWVVVNDLVRSWVAAGAIWALARALTGNQLVRHDGPLSVLKAFAPDEFLSLAHAAGADGGPPFRWRLERTFPYRMTLVGARCDG